MASQSASQDPNRFPALIGHSDTTDSAETRKVVVDDDGNILIRVGNDLIDTLHELIQRLAPLAGAMANTAQLRVVAGSTAVTGPQTSAQMIATYNVAGVNYTQRIATENLTATLANINNCIAA